MPIQEAEIRRIAVQSWPGQIVPLDPISKKPFTKIGPVERLKVKALNSTPVLQKKKGTKAKVIFPTMSLIYNLPCHHNLQFSLQDPQLQVTASTACLASGNCTKCKLNKEEDPSVQGAVVESGASGFLAGTLENKLKMDDVLLRSVPSAMPCRGRQVEGVGQDIGELSLRALFKLGPHHCLAFCTISSVVCWVEDRSGWDGECSVTDVYKNKAIRVFAPTSCMGTGNVSFSLPTFPSPYFALLY
jgi:hypothetical protein